MGRQNSVGKSNPVEQYGGTRRASPMRLPSHDVGILRLLWGGIASRMGLGSNYETMVAGVMDSKSRVNQVIEIPGMQDGQQTLSIHYWDGNVMHIKSQAIVRKGFVCRCLGDCGCNIELSALEKWACWSNHLNGTDGKEVSIAYEAVDYMIDEGKSDLVGILYRMYGGVTPFWRYGQFQSLGDLVPVAPDTKAITKHTFETGGEWAAMERVMVRHSGDTKAQDKAREALTKSVKIECEKILIRASAAYLDAKKHV